MIDIWTWPTPNGQKVHIAIEELGLPYTIVPVAIGRGEQFKPEFLAITPNHRIPAIVDHDGPGGRTVTLFESGAILIYLAEKAGRLIPADPIARAECLQWLMFQMGGVAYAIERYQNEAIRLVRVLEKRLAKSEYLAGAEYSIADIATFPWIRSANSRGLLPLDAMPGVQRWLDVIAARPAVVRGMAILADQSPPPTLTDEARDALFGKTQHAVR